jgi:hypothetical protein
MSCCVTDIDIPVTDESRRVQAELFIVSVFWAEPTRATYDKRMNGSTISISDGDTQIRLAPSPTNRFH